MKARPVKKLDPSRSLGENAARIIQVRLDEMMAFAPRALDGKTKAQHDMRIAAKRLRYVLEVTGFVFGKPADTARRRARDLQDILGEIHDCDVMLPRVREHYEAAPARRRPGRSGAGPAEPRTSIRGWPPEPPTGPPTAGSMCSRSTWRRAGAALEDRFIAFWRRQEETGTWLRLERAIDGYLHRAREARRTARAAERARAQAEAAERAARQAEAQAEQARLDRERASREAEEQSVRHEQVLRRTPPPPPPRRPS